MDEPTVHFSLEEDDILALHYAAFPKAHSWKWTAAAVGGAASVVVSAIIFWMFNANWAAFVALMFGLVALSVWYRRRPRYVVRTAMKRFPGLYRREGQTLRVTAEGILGEEESSKGTTAYSAVQRIEETPTHLFLFFHATQAMVIPRRAFSDNASYTAFFKAIEQYRSAADPLESKEPDAGYQTYHLAYSLSPPDYLAWAQVAGQRLGGRRGWVFWPAIAIVAFVLVPVMFFVGSWQSGLAFLFLTSLVTTLRLSTPHLWVWSQKRRMTKNPEGYPNFELNLYLGPAGVQVVSQRGRAQMPWWRFCGIEDRDSHLFLLMSDRLALIIPQPIDDQLLADVLSWQSSAVAPRQEAQTRLEPIEVSDPFSAPRV